MSIQAAVAERLLRDQEARDAITLVLDRNMMVLAGAGAGKTHALIERMVALIREGCVEANRIAAITFTRKAAGEMRGRFLRRLRKEQDRVTGEEWIRVRAALQHIDQCFIGTIHSFCGRLLRERPIEAGLPPDFEEIEEREEARFRREAWDQFVQERIAADDDRIFALEEHGIQPEDLYTFLGRRCGYRDLPLKETTTPRPDLRAPVAELKKFVDVVLPRIPSNPESRDKLMDTVRRAKHFLENHGIETDRDRAALLKLFDGKLTPILKHWGDERAFAKDLKDHRLPEFQNHIVDPALTRWRECAYRLVADFVDDAADYYDRMRLAKGKVTFQDLLLRAEAVLRDNPPVRAYFQRRFQCILVDEFQDTDPIQARIVMYLAGSDVEEKDWLKLNPRPGSLFLVGDDKQSIYRFRRADVETFRQVRRRLDETGGAIIHLNTSFRSLGNLCQWLSTSFPAIFSAPGDPYQARFEPLYDYRPAGLDAHCVRRITLPKVHGNKRDEIVELDAARIAGYIAAAIRGETPINQGGEGAVLDREASPGDFMILTRTSTRLSIYARALEARGVPFDLVGGSRLGEAEELKALVNMLEAIYAPDNPIPYLSYLRGPLVGLGDDELYALRRAGGWIRYRSNVPDGLEPELYRRIMEARKLLEEAEETLRTRPPGSAIEQILEHTGLLSYAAVHPDGQSSFRAGNLLRVLSVVRAHEAKGRHWGAILEDLHELTEDGDYDLEEMTLEAGREDVVRLMNLHQAKGLQAKVVFLADPYDLSAYRWQPDMHVSRADEPYLAMTVLKPRSDYGAELVAQPAGWQDDLREEELFEAAEEVRLLYVAATRAANLLVVSEYQGNIDRGPWHQLHWNMKNVPELSDCTARLHDRRAAGDVDWVHIRDTQADKLRQAGKPSHRVRTVSGASEDDELQYFAREGRGRSYGIIIHQLFEDAVAFRLPENVRAYIRQLVAGAGLDDKYASDAEQALLRFKASRIWYEVSRAKEVFTEVPLGRCVHSEESSDLVRGVIDLIYRYDGGWKIVDYKTDAASTEAEVASLERKYRAQIMSYAEHWEEITGEEVVSSEPWFVHGPAKEDQLTLF